VVIYDGGRSLSLAADTGPSRRSFDQLGSANSSCCGMNSRSSGNGSLRPLSSLMRVEKIVSGGQTGADQAALDVALERGLQVGGWVPKGRLAEDGPIPERYSGLVETQSSDPAVRTSLNLRDSDATLIVSHSPADPC
jgi:hypothetical protein